MKLYRFVILIFTILSAIAADGKPIRLPKWMLTSAEGEYIGISFSGAPKEQAVVSAIFCYVISQNTACDGKGQIEDFVSLGRLVRTVGKADFSYAGELSYNLIREERLPSGEWCVAIAKGTGNAVSYTMNMVKEIASDEECVVKEYHGTIILDGNTDWSFSVYSSGPEVRIWGDKQKHDNNPRMQTIENLGGAHAECTFGVGSDTCRYSSGDRFVYKRIPDLKYKDYKNLDSVTCEYLDAVSESGLEYNLAGAWTQMLCDILFDGVIHSNFERGLYDELASGMHYDYRAATPIWKILFDGRTFATIAIMDKKSSSENE